MNKQSDTTFRAVGDKINQYLDDRDWRPTKQRGRSIAISISLEANELLEHFQWQDKADGSNEELSDELADIMIYCFQFAEAYDIDMSKAIQNKLKKQEKKYLAKLFKGKKNAHDDWLNVKIAHNKEKDTL